jgi:hypothetical protein
MWSADGQLNPELEFVVLRQSSLAAGPKSFDLTG